MTRKQLVRELMRAKKLLNRLQDIEMLLKLTPIEELRMAFHQLSEREQNNCMYIIQELLGIYELDLIREKEGEK